MQKLSNWASLSYFAQQKAATASTPQQAKSSPQARGKTDLLHKPRGIYTYSRARQLTTLGSPAGGPRRPGFSSSAGWLVVGEPCPPTGAGGPSLHAAAAYICGRLAGRPAVFICWASRLCRRICLLPAAAPPALLALPRVLQPLGLPASDAAA